MVYLGNMCDRSDPQRFVWFGKAAVLGWREHFWREMREKVIDSISGIRCSTLIFAIGRALKGHVDNEKRTIFGEHYNFDDRIGPANHALRFYKFQLRSYRRAVNSWTIIGLRNKVVKDIRKMIGKMIWELREEADYLEEQ
jgi:hypothetical protein